MYYSPTLENELLEAVYQFGEQAGTRQEVHSSGEFPFPSFSSLTPGIPSNYSHSNGPTVIYMHYTASSDNNTALAVFYANTANVASPVLSNFTKVAPSLSSALRSTNLLSLVNELGIIPANGHPELMTAVAFKNNLEKIQLTRQVHDKAFIKSDHEIILSLMLALYCDLFIRIFWLRVSSLVETALA